MRNSPHFTKNTLIHNVVWYGYVCLNCSLSFRVAEAIPLFSDLLSLVGAFLSTLLSLQVPCVSERVNELTLNTVEGMMYMYLYDCCTYQEPPAGTLKRKIVHTLNMIMIVTSVFCMIAATHSAIVIIKEHVNDDATTKPFCWADNSKYPGSNHAQGCSIGGKKKNST
ncbi:hypothetical protein CcaverHIS002_0209520 [Cutaneotrichosporon cavernicola]|uniref:Uncharacterized protein n=1 Tax=Cutaneotrichosporon cavernicola TaxID=279322 RepID=A0AA48I5A9_9TREE|nr:uncharacterized protein CcaverHIS019_0209540 [Cutaneotrichosporon cavernicola]BEI81792.1 hypothetical protein CcaverHIS002_0209520 [Cutaneotrichosporon cavernicola]BEI89592.1 hypothetical protein CcaverHIS019_0209540 [Cutaneotrichosporon cavernicola]BEJ05140.1 hypothetical protein CcaverHIS641_0209570 [Cutaneotrichosporon cavernicola]